MAVDFAPGVGDAKGLIEVGTGRDLITGEELGAWRWAGLFGLVGLAEIRYLRYTDEAGDLIKSASRIDPDWLAGSYNDLVRQWLDAYDGGQSLDDFLRFIENLREEYLDLYQQYLTGG